MMLDAFSVYDRLKKYFPEIEAFRVPLEESYTLDCTPGKQIDLANAVFECIGKHAWSNTTTAPSDKVIEKAKLSAIIAGAKPFFDSHDPDFYEDVFDALVKPAVRILGNRSERGDISHGHLSTKEELSLAHAAMSLNLALSFATYYFMILEISTARMNYDAFSDEGGFNEWLNNRGERIGGASYSWLIYSHDYDAYESFFDEYQAEHNDIVRE